MTTTRYSLSTARQQAISLGFAAVMTVAVMMGIGSLADGYRSEAQQMQAASAPQHMVAVRHPAPRS